MIYPNFGMLLKLHIFKMILSFLHGRSYNGSLYSGPTASSVKMTVQYQSTGNYSSPDRK